MHIVSVITLHLMLLMFVMFFRRQVQSAINADANDAPDDEGLYMLVTQPPDEHTNNAQAANTSPPEPCANADANDVAAAEGGVPLEAEINDADPQEVHVIHDPENSKNCEGRVVARYCCI